MSKSPALPTSKNKNWLEWTVFVLGAACLTGVIAVLVHQSVTTGEEPARLLVRMGTPLVGSDQVRIPVWVVNEGDEPAVAVVIEIDGTSAGSVQSSSLHFDYVPHRSHREGWISFPGEEVPANLSARVLSYTGPASR